MTKQELKTLSDQTFTSNGKGTITASGHRAFNDALIDAMPEYVPYVEVGGVKWDTSNVPGYYSFDAANRVAASLNKRLPTREEFQTLLTLPHVMDSNNYGVWFANSSEDLKNPLRSVFFHIPGIFYEGGGAYAYLGEFLELGAYWSGTKKDNTTAYILWIDGDVYENERGTGEMNDWFCVRLVQRV